jgi:hypothetical protein
MSRNVIAPNTEEPAKIVALVAKWDYQRAVERIRPRIEKWAGLTAEIVRELYIARKYLNGQKGQRKDQSAEDYIWYTWNDFCQAIGLSRQTANGFLRRFIPAELSESGEDKLYSPEEWKFLNPPDVPMTTREEERLIARFINTGERPEGWNKGLERIVQERKSAQKAKEVAELWMGRFHREVRRDYFADIQAMAGKNKRFRLKTKEQIDAQNVMFRTIHEYFELFKSLDDLMAAAANLTDKVRFAANYFAELLVDTGAVEEE